MGIKGNKKNCRTRKRCDSFFVGTLSSAENLENQLEDSVNYLLAQSVLFEESENVADKLQESLKKLRRFLASRLKLRKKLDYLVNERCDEFHDLLPPFYIYGN